MRLNMELLHFLWKNGAKPESPFLEKIFNRFEAGLLPKDYNIASKINNQKIDTIEVLELENLAINDICYDIQKDQSSSEVKINLLPKLYFTPLALCTIFCLPAKRRIY